MLNYIFVLTAPGAAFSRDEPAAAAGNMIVSFLVDPGADHQLPELYRLCNNNYPRPFALSINADSALSHSFVQKLLSFFFIPSYYSIGNHRVLALLGSDN